MNNSLAGVWHEVSGSFDFHIAGSEPRYSFETRSAGVITEQGFIERMPDGLYLAQGNGLAGPFRMRFSRPHADHLHGKRDLGLDALAPLIGNFSQFMDPFLPTVTLVRRARPTAVRSTPQQAVTRNAAKPPEPLVLAITDLLVDRAEEEFGIDVDGRAGLRRRLQEAAGDVCRKLGEQEKAMVVLSNFVDGQTFITRVMKRDLDALTPGQRKPSREKRAPAPPDPRPEAETSPLEELDALIGMGPVKEQVRKLDAWAWLQRQLRDQGKAAKAHSLHMCFAGPPGTGKTTVARIVGRLLKQAGLLNRGEVLEVSRADLIAEYVGQTAPRTTAVIKKAIGGVLFIDEAYALTEPGASKGADYGGEALAVLIAEMENRRAELCIIVAGYESEMERFLDANAGMASRISRRIVFPDFTDDELCEIFTKMIKADDRTCDDAILPMLRWYVKRAKETLPARKWGNARSVRNILEAGVENQALRLRASDHRASLEDLLHLTREDFSFLEGPEIQVY